MSSVCKGGLTWKLSLQREQDRNKPYHWGSRMHCFGHQPSPAALLLPRQFAQFPQWWMLCFFAWGVNICLLSLLCSKGRKGVVRAQLLLKPPTSHSHPWMCLRAKPLWESTGTQVSGLEAVWGTVPSGSSSPWFAVTVTLLALTFGKHVETCPPVMVLPNRLMVVSESIFYSFTLSLIGFWEEEKRNLCTQPLILN